MRHIKGGHARSDVRTAFEISARAARLAAASERRRVYYVACKEEGSRVGDFFLRRGKEVLWVFWQSVCACACWCR